METAACDSNCALFCFFFFFPLWAVYVKKVKGNIVEPVLGASGCGDDADQSGKPTCDQGTFLEEFKNAGERLVQRLKEQPVIVAHAENTFDGSAVRRLLSSKLELDKVTSQLWPYPFDIRSFDLPSLSSRCQRFIEGFMIVSFDHLIITSYTAGVQVGLRKRTERLPWKGFQGVPASGSGHSGSLGRPATARSHWSGT